MQESETTQARQLRQARDGEAGPVEHVGDRVAEGVPEPSVERSVERVGEPLREHAVRARLDGELAFLSQEAQVQRTAELLGEGAVVVDAGSPPASMRGRLAEHLDERVERALGIRGAPSPYITAWSAMPDDADARLADQLFRAHALGATGIAIAMGSLSRIAAPALTPEDSATLRALAKATESAALVMMLDDGDAGVGGYGEPVALQVMLGVNGDAHAKANADADADAKTDAKTDADAVGGVVDVVLEADGIIAEVCVATEAETIETHVDAPVAEVTAEQAEAARIARAEMAALAAKAERADRAERLVRAERVEKDAARRRQTAGVPVAGPSDFWRSWAIALGAARGPQPLASFEKLFVESYMPLANAIACGLDDPRAVRAHDEFRSGFERSYTDAFATFGATGRRPRLVMDAYDVAVKQARLHNARTTHVLVVDAMRHDLGCLVRDQVAARAAGIASLTSESLLWSALPTTTYRQLETLARGMDALRAPAVEETTESLRGRSAETVRRLRVGSRELYKLDVVPSMLGVLPDPVAGTGPAHVIAALEDIAASVADALLRHVETLPPRTLLLVVGDHGFTVDRRGRISDGGASPEEVLVPCLAYLVGELH
jgi:hypothetical protein